MLLVENEIKYVPVNACSLLQGLKVRNPHTYAHSVRVSMTAVKVANILSKSPNFVIDVYMAAMLHDVGKLLVPEDVLTAPRKLTPLEKQLVDTHAENGANLLVYMQSNIRDAIRLHHTNYEDMCPVNDIACILKVCDVFDALTSKRCYKDYLPIDDSLAIMEKGVNTEFEPNAFKALCTVVNNERYGDKYQIYG